MNEIKTWIKRPLEEESLEELRNMLMKSMEIIGIVENDQIMIINEIDKRKIKNN